jgi:hypothetical protein
MNKLAIVFLLSIASSFCSKGQSLQAGVEAGASVAFSKIVFDNSRHNGISEVSSKRISLRFGIPIQYSLGESLQLSSGIYYAAKGVNTYPPKGFQAKYISYSSIELPVILSYKSGSADRTRFFIGLGPYFGYGISGKVKYYNQSFQQKNDKASFGNNTETNDLKPFEMGAQFQSGIELVNGLSGKITIQSQLNNLANTPSTDPNLHSISQIKTPLFISLTLVYLLKFNNRNSY